LYTISIIDCPPKYPMTRCPSVNNPTSHIRRFNIPITVTTPELPIRMSSRPSAPKTQPRHQLPSGWQVELYSIFRIRLIKVTLNDVFPITLTSKRVGHNGPHRPLPPSRDRPLLNLSITLRIQPAHFNRQKHSIRTKHNTNPPQRGK